MQNKCRAKLNEAWKGTKMLHLTDITWIQMLLIEVGVVLQVVAIYAYFKGIAYYRQAHHGDHEPELKEERERDFQTAGDAHSRQKLSARAEGQRAPGHNHEFKAGRLTRTAKVGGFSQSFKFRE
jgi:hypothetical protein